MLKRGLAIASVTAVLASGLDGEWIGPAMTAPAASRVLSAGARDQRAASQDPRAPDGSYDSIPSDTIGQHLPISLGCFVKHTSEQHSESFAHVRSTFRHAILICG